MSTSIEDFLSRTISIDQNYLLNITLEKTLESLSGYYYPLAPQDGINGLREKFFRQMRNDPACSGDLIKRDCFALREREIPVNHELSVALIACAYCADVSKFLERDELELAWAAMSEAKYWCGVCLANQIVESLRQATIAASRKAVAKKAGKARASQQVDGPKAEAFRLIRLLRPANGWKSRRAAVEKIRKQVVAFSKQGTGTPLVDSESGVVRTLQRWIPTMPDLIEMFPPKNKNSTPKF